MDFTEFKKPINIVNLILAILGIGIGIYFYFQSKEFRAISYQVDKTASIIYDITNTSSKVKLIEADSSPISQNVYYVRGKIWNSGNMPISISDVRQQLVLSLNSCKRILDFKIEKQYEDSTQKFQLTKVTENKLGISWHYFDPHNGFSFQLIYLGSENPEPALNGKILGVSNFKFIESNKKTPTWISILLSVVPFLIGWWADRLLPAILGRQSKINLFWRTIIVMIIAVSFTAVILLLYNKFFTSAPPF